MTLSNALEAVEAANRLLKATTEDGKPLLNFKKIKLAHSLGQVIDAISPEVQRYQKNRTALLEDLGKKMVAFSSAKELSGYEVFSATQLSPEQKTEHEGRMLYQTHSEHFEKLDKTELKVVDASMFMVPQEKIQAFNDALQELVSTEVTVSVRIPVEAFDNIDYEVVPVVLALHEIVDMGGIKSWD